MKDLAKTTEQYRQYNLFEPETLPTKASEVYKLSVKKVAPRFRTTPDRPYALYEKRTGQKLLATYSFSIALGICERTTGFDWERQTDGQPRCLWKLKGVIQDMTGNLENFGVSKC